MSQIRRAAPWLGLVVLTTINLLNYLDRFVVPALEESLRHSTLGLSDKQFGSLASAFLIVYMLTAPAFGTLGDRGPRPRLIAAGVAVWSVATALGGLAGSYWALLTARAIVGIGEASYSAIAPSLLADYFPPALRGRVFSIFFAATPVGGALGYIVGGLVDRHYGWRHAFFVAGVPGLLFALAALRLADPPRGSQDPATPPPAHGEGGSAAAYGVLARNIPYLLIVLGYAAYTFAVGGIAVWMPAFLERVRGLPAEQATVRFGTVLVATGLIGSFAGGWIADYMLRFTRHAYLWVSGAATLAAAPLAYLALTASAPSQYWPSLIAAEFLIFVSTGPINSAIVNAVPPTMRAAAMAASILTIHLLGDVPSPYLIGVISDASSLARAVLVIPVAIVVSAAIWLGAARRPDPDSDPTPVTSSVA